MSEVSDALTLVQRFAGDPFFERQCHGKIAHLDERAAKDAAKRQHKRVKRKYNTYICRFCNQWHIGKRSKPHPI